MRPVSVSQLWRFFLVPLCLILLPLPASSKDLQLPSEFRFHEGDSIGWRDRLYDDRSWSTVAVPGKVKLSKTNVTGRYWYRVHFEVPETVAARSAIFLGKIGDIDEVYLNGKLLGYTGRFYPGGSAPLHRVRVYQIPEGWLEPGTTNTLAIRAQNIWNLHVGLYQGQPIIGDYETLQEKASFDYFFTSGLSMLLAFFSIVMGIYHLFLYIRLPFKRLNLLYFFFALTSGLFMLSLGLKTVEWFSNPSFVVRFHALAGIVTIALLHAFILGTTRKKVSAFDYVLFAANGLFLVAMLVPRDHGTIYAIFNAWYLLALVLLVYLSVITIQVTRRSRNDLRLLAVAIVFGLCTAFSDVLYGLGLINFVQVSSIGFFAFNLGIMFSLAHDFTGAYLNVEQKVAARTKDLSVANEQLRALEKMKAKFFANVSHDFKTPIAIAFANIEQAKNGLGRHEQQPLTAAETALNRLQGMVADLLDLTRAESGTLKPRWSRAYLGEAIEMWSKPYELLCSKKGLYLNVRNLLKGVRVPFDPEKLERAFANLVSNAIKFTDEGGVSISIRGDEAQVFIEVADTGPGVKKEEREIIFDRFVQGFNTTLKDHGGSGIGLSFVREVVSLHNGRIWVEGEEGKGSQFTIALPLDQDVEITGEYEVSEKEIRVVAPKGSIEMPYPRTEPESLDANKPTILSIEDNSEIAQILLGALEPVYNVYCAKNGRVGLDLLSQTTVDCILCDVMMPEMDGTEFLQALRATPALQMVPVIMVTSKGEDDDVILHLGLGAQDYVTKPFKRNVLLARVGSQVETLRLRNRLLAADKMVTLGLLTAGIAHEIKNPLSAALNNITGAKAIIGKSAAITSDDSTAAAEAKEYLKKKTDMLNQAFDIAVRATERIRTLVKAMGNYSTGSKQRIEISLSEAIDEALELVEHKRKVAQVVVSRTEDRSLKILGYASLNQVFVNLFANAIEAIEGEGGEIHVKTLASSEGKIRIEIQDTGTGIAPEHLGKIFDPFMTTKPPGQGTGLGLFVTKNVVEIQHGGKISTASQRQKGTTFVIELPKEAPEGISGAATFHGVETAFD